MMNTSVANVVFIISTQTMFLAVFGFVYLREKVSLIKKQLDDNEEALIKNLINGKIDKECLEIAKNLVKCGLN